MIISTIVLPRRVTVICRAYKIVRIKIKAGMPEDIEDFATGWLQGLRAWGRPVDVIVGPDGSLYVSDDRGGVVYRITAHK